MLAEREQDAAGAHPPLEPGHPELDVVIGKAREPAEERLPEGRLPLPGARGLVVEPAEVEEDSLPVLDGGGDAAPERLPHRVAEPARVAVPPDRVIALVETE